MEEDATVKMRNPILRLVNFLFTLCLLAVFVAGVLFFWAKREFDGEGPLKVETTIVIPKGAHLSKIAGMLEDSGIIRSALLFNSAVRFNNNERDIKAGEYKFDAHASMRSVMTDLVAGNFVLYSITIPEGWTSQQVVNRLNSEPNLEGEVADVPEEGTLLPETYLFSRGMERKELLNRMHDALMDVLGEVWEKRDPDIPVESPEELLILASIVEKETGQSEERDRVAGVFVNRLKNGMRLQSDPTILYGLYGGQAWTRSRTILKSELKKANSYNTYQIPALPPGPIANVGREALKAAANPKKTDELYFVADGSGGHAFAETYEEHLKNVKKWRQIERNFQ